MKIDTSHKEGNNPKHTAVTASCEHRPFSHNLGLTYLRGLLSPEDQSLREKRVSPVPFALGQLTSHPWCLALSVTKSQDNESVCGGGQVPQMLTKPLKSRGGQS